MKAILFPQPETIELTTVDDPTCGPNDVVVKIEMTGICGTDLHIYRNEYMSDFPLIPGHEFGGRVVEVGQEVQTGIKIGDRVAVDPNLYCGECEFCRREEANHCLNWQGVGVTRAHERADSLNMWQYQPKPVIACQKAWTISRWPLSSR